MSNMGQLDDSQRQVVEAGTGYHLVLAPPGCGKTHILAERIKRALQAGMKSSDMLCLTFTNRAAREMQRRCAVDDNSLFVGNIHRFCARFLFEEGKVAADTSIIDDDEAISIIADYRNEDDESVAGDYQRSRSYQEIIFFSHLMSQMEQGHAPELYLHPESLSDSDKEAMADLCLLQRWDNDRQTLLDVYRHAENYLGDDDLLPRTKTLKMQNLLWKMYYASQYEAYKRDNHMLDFEDLLLKTYAIYSREPDCRRYKWIQVDEVQDLNAMQLAIIDQLTDPHDATVMYLGDEQQAIFSFMGAKVEMLDVLKRRCVGHLYHLNKNHRSPRYLLEVFNDYAAKRLHIDPALLPLTEDTTAATADELRILHSDTAATEVRDVAQWAGGLQHRYPDETVAVVVSSNADADAISEEMGQMGLTHFKVSGRDMFDTKDLKFLLAHLHVLTRACDFISWVRLFRGMKVFSTNALARRFVRKLKQLAISPTDLLRQDGQTYVADFLHGYESGEIVVFDTETTGLNVFEDDIVEIAAMRIRNGQVVAPAFDVYIRTDREIPTMLGDIPNPMKAIYQQKERDGQLMEPAEALQAFLTYVGGKPVLGHNVKYDERIVVQQLLRHGMADAATAYTDSADVPTCFSTVFDSLKLMMLLAPNQHSYKLETLLKDFALAGCNSHRAIDDVEATVNLLALCQREAATKIPLQRAFLAHPKVTPLVRRFRNAYQEPYLHAARQLYLQDVQPTPALIRELDWAYEYFLTEGFVQALPRLSYMKAYLLHDLMADADAEPSLYSQLQRYLLDISTMKEADFCNSRSIEEKVYVTTVHKAKGLEFDSVIVFDAVSGRYPNYHNKHPRQDAEDARKFYVAMSRAKRRLYVAYSMQTVDRYGGIHNREISPFMADIMHYFS